MSGTWQSEVPPEWHRIGPAGWLRVLRRGIPIAIVTFGGLGLLLLVRLVEAPVFGEARPVTPRITRAVCRANLWLMGLTYVVRGRPMVSGGAQVANHSSWLDIFALNACQTVYFVSKSEVASWPGIGWLARATGTVFVRRTRQDATQQVGLFRERLSAGHKLLFFPEGTSSDGRRLLPFKSTLFEAFFDPSLRPSSQLQPITVIYEAPTGADPRLYGWWGDMDFGPHLLQTLATPTQGKVIVVFDDPLAVSDMTDRKGLARALQDRVRARLDQAGVTSSI